MGPPGCAAWCRVGRGAGNQGHPPRLLHRRTPEARLFPGHADRYSPAPSAVTLHSQWELCLWLWGMWAGWAELATALCPRDSCHGNGMGAKEGAAVSLGYNMRSAARAKALLCVAACPLTHCHCQPVPRDFLGSGLNQFRGFPV